MFVVPPFGGKKRKKGKKQEDKWCWHSMIVVPPFFKKKTERKNTRCWYLSLSYLFSVSVGTFKGVGALKGCGHGHL